MGDGLTVGQFLQALYADAGAGWIEIRGQAPATKGKLDYRQWFPWPPGGEHIEKVLAPHVASLNLWFGVGLRRERGGGKKEHVGAISAVWLDLDFAKVPRDEAIKRLREFPLRPSIGVESGGGFHVYWLLKELLFQSEFAKAEAVMRAVANVFGGDPECGEVARVLRVPNTLNLKYDPPRPVKIVVGPHLDRRYSLLDFDFLPVEERTARETTAPARPCAAPTRELPTALIQKLAELLTGIWAEGYRHELALYVAGMLAHAGYCEDSARRVIRAVVTFASDSEGADREAAVGDTYARFTSGQTVAGSPSLEEAIDRLPPAIRAKAKKVYEIVKKTIPKQSRWGGPNPNFEIIRIVKFDSRPARFVVTIRFNEADYAVPCEIGTLSQFSNFRIAFTEETPNLFLNGIKQARWEELVSMAPLEIREAPKEATMRGSIETELAIFLDDRHENADPSILKTFAGYNDTETYFTLTAFQHHLKEKAIRATTPEITHVLKDLGWEPDKRRMGDKTARLWTKAHQNGHPKPSQDLLGSQPE